MNCDFSDYIAQFDTGNSQWFNIQIVGDEDELLESHVVPIEDSGGHKEGLTCHCSPEIQYRDPDTGQSYIAPLVIHNAFDGRHVVEEAEKILSQ